MSHMLAMLFLVNHGELVSKQFIGWNKTCLFSLRIVKKIGLVPLKQDPSTTLLREPKSNPSKIYKIPSSSKDILGPPPQKMEQPKVEKGILGIPPKLISLLPKPIPSILGPHPINLKATMSPTLPKPIPCAPLEPKPHDKGSFL